MYEYLSFSFLIVTLQIALTLQLLCLLLPLIWKEMRCLSPLSFIFTARAHLETRPWSPWPLKKKKKKKNLVSSMAEDKQDEPKGQNTGGWASFLYSPQQTPQKICFDGATFCRKPPGLIATTHCLKTLYLWRFQPTASPAVTQPLASIREKRTPTQRKNNTRLAPKIRRGNIVFCVLF